MSGTHRPSLATLSALVLALAFTTAAPPSGARAQAITVEVDLRTPARAYDGDPQRGEYALDRGLACRLGYASRNCRDVEARHRWLLALGFQSVTTTSVGPGRFETRYRATSLDFGHDWRLWRRPWASLSAGVTGGLVLVSHRSDPAESCDSPFCNLPDGGWQLAGQARVDFPLSPKFGMLLGVRGRLWGPRREDVFPFAPGPVISVGIQLG